ncbi:hypothetical protein CR513_05671, partial [Mucuna pruriens]
MEKKVEQYTKCVNEGKSERDFKEGDLVWVNLRKKRFPSLRKSKLLLRREEEDNVGIDMKDMDPQDLKGPINRGRLKRLQKEQSYLSIYKVSCFEQWSGKNNWFGKDV